MNAPADPLVALVGNPNTGKSTLFNALTGLRQRVGNYPGVTVARKSGTCDLGDGRKVELLDLPVHLDMTGTACAAVVLGPWWGALVGLATNAAGMAVSGPASLLFAPVNIAGALIWGYGVRRFAMASSVPRFFLLNLLVAAVCSSIAVPLIVTVDHGFSGHGTDAVTHSAQVFLASLWASVAVSNVLTSVVDKLISGFFVMAVVESLPARVRASMSAPWLRLGGPQA